ncbi:DUF4132 domain-containing protein [Chitinophaga silvatica]|uniref:DUF4132 domain-containing protein n=1 Tax=Chitinophaga silvatica TaxID=2282649 RepID=A0A3E1YHE3_9BACT|nr:DUF4132 domain-containing protein [Chitinophaga silvatica]RFS26843.1 DUF4132 domain-containing protein [Chitinophaga silvatica]
MPYTKETILPLVDELKQRNNYADIAASIQAGVDFLTGQTYETPVFEEATAAQPLGRFMALLQSPDLWNENDRLVLQLISTPITWEGCKDAFLKLLVPTLDAPGTSSSIVLRFSNFTNFLQDRGCTPEEIGSLLIDYSGHGNNFDLSPLKFSPLRKFLQDLIKSADPQTITAYLRTWKNKGWNSLFYRLLAKGHPEREMEYLENVFLNTSDTATLMKVMLQNNFTRYEPLVENSTAHWTSTASYGNALAGYYLLAAHLPEKYQQKVISVAYDCLNMPTTSLSDNSVSELAVKELLQYDLSNAVPYLQTHIQQQRYLHAGAFQAVADTLKDNAVPLLLQALNNDYDARLVLPVLIQLSQSLYLDELWPFTLHKLKSVRSLVAPVLALHPQALEKAGELLQHKKADQRLTAAQILCKINTSQAHQLLQQTLDTEVNDDARDLMIETLGAGQSGTLADLVDAAKKRNKLSKPIEKWLDESSFPPLYLLDGSIASLDTVRFLLYRMSRAEGIKPDVEAKVLLAQVDRFRSNTFGLYLFELFLERGSDAKLKYLLITAAATGDDSLIVPLQTTVQHWIDTKRFKLMEIGMGALAMHGSSAALRAVEYFSRRYRVKKANVGTTALAALQAAAEEQQTSLHELCDLIVPTFDFEGKYRAFVIKDETYFVSLDHQFKPIFFNKKYKQLKSLPTAVAPATRESFKTLAKTISEVVKVQTERLENFMVIQRPWNVKHWQSVFLQSAIMNVFATRILWAAFNNNDQLIATFHSTEDGTLSAADGTAIILPENASIKIAHPVYLDNNTLHAWKQKFATENITPVFPQLERPVATLVAEAATNTLIEDFEDIVINTEQLNKHLEQKGWKLSEGIEGAYSYSWYKTNDEHQLEAIIEMSSIYQDDSFHYRLGTLYFVDKTKTSERWFNNTDKASLNCLLPLIDVPPVFYSEAIMDLASNC